MAWCVTEHTDSFVFEAGVVIPGRKCGRLLYTSSTGPVRTEPELRPKNYLCLSLCSGFAVLVSNIVRVKVSSSMKLDLCYWVRHDEVIISHYILLECVETRTRISMCFHRIMVHKLAMCDVIALHCPVPLNVVIESINKRYFTYRLDTEI
jgi:hypothetical protein